MENIKLSVMSKSFIQALNVKGVEYLVVGGYAVGYYGFPRFTRDLDLWTDTAPANALKISELLQDWLPDRPQLTPELFQHPNRIVRFTFALVEIQILDPIIGQKPELLDHFQAGTVEQIEILTLQSGVNFSECYLNRVVDIIDGIEVNFISLNDLKMIKQAGDRAKDLEDLNQLH